PLGERGGRLVGHYRGMVIARFRASRCGVKTVVMGPFHTRMVVALVAVWAAMLAGGPAVAQTAIKFTLDGKIEGPAAPFVVAIDKGYFKAQGLEVSIDSAATPADAIGRVASGSYDMGFADINAVIKFRDQNPGAAVK